MNYLKSSLKSSFFSFYFIFSSNELFKYQNPYRDMHIMERRGVGENNQILKNFFISLGTTLPQWTLTLEDCYNIPELVFFL